ncbi:MAG TPA: hypothetical protein VNZ57_12580, partial [Longimicrobiales bacterium]|nr:hypothetical protein [Longimicrobiales bacterium]
IPITDEVAAQFADILGVSPDDVKKAAGPSGPPGFEDYQIRTNPDKGNRVEHWHDGEWRVMEQDPATGQWFYQKKVAPGHWTKVYI